MVRCGDLIESGVGGDWLVQNADGEQWVVNRSNFDQIYQVDTTPTQLFN